MNQKFSRAAVIASLTALVTGASACVGAGSGSLSTVVEALEGARNASPFVEGYVQYLGPDARWAGPTLWTLYVSAKDGTAPIFELTPKLPALAAPSTVEVMQRMPASALGMTQMQAVPETRKYSSEEVRERLATLASAVQAAEAETQPCSTGVRVRLIRADGSVLERQGCRASAQWSQLVSEFSAEYMSASRAPAGVPVQEERPVEAKAPTSDHG